MQRPFRFGVLMHNTDPSLQRLRSAARTTEDLGYDTFLLPDHLADTFAPTPALAAIANDTMVLRVGSAVFANDFRHPLLLAKEVATLDVLSGGRVEFGLGAGWMRREYEQAGIAYDRGQVRIERMEEALRLMKQLFAEQSVTFRGKHYTVSNVRGLPPPIQRPHPPIFVGGGGKQVLSLAAREADIVGLTCRVQADGGQLDATDGLLPATRRKVEWIRQAAGERLPALEINILLMDVLITDRPQQDADQSAQRFALTTQQVLESPHFLVGTIEQICEALYGWREQLGISYVVVWEEHLTAFAPVVARLRGQ